LRAGAGFVTIGGTDYSQEGTVIYRLFRSGSWLSRWNLPSVTNFGNNESTGQKTSLFNFSSTNNYPNSKALFDGLATKQNNLGFTPENVANKATTMTGNTSSNTLYLTAKAIFDYVTATFVRYAEYASHSILAQQSGTGSPSSVPIGNDQILGRLSGGSSNIKGLSVSEVKGLLDLENTNTGDETQSSILTKIGAGNWVDYSSLSTVVGWSSTTQLDIYYRQIFGDTYECYYRISGTSNDTVATFTLPFNFLITFGFVGTCINNGAANIGRNSAIAGGSVATCTATATGTSFTASGTKAILGQFMFRAS
jgi:hypothetical protein